MTEREAPPGWGFDYRQADPYEDDGWFGREQIAEPMPQAAEPMPRVAAPAPVDPVDEIPDRPPSQSATEERYEAPLDLERSVPPPTRRVYSPTVSTWTVNGQLRASNNSTLTFRAPPQPWYRTKQARIALIAVAVAAVAVPIVLLAFRGDSATSPQQSTSVAPQPSTTAQPVPSSAPPAPVNAPPPPPPPRPPTPPPTEDTGSAPTYNEPDWTRSAPPPQEKPDVGVTRTPATRAPISVAPQPRQTPSGATPGEGRKGWNCGGWC